MPGGARIAVGWSGSAGACASGSSPSREFRRAEPEAVRAELGRVLADPLFSNSRRCTSLLKYVVEKSLDGAEELKERTIGTEVFRRAPDYDTSQDPTVRIATAEVRKRLMLYYSQAGAEQALRIELPLHSYLAEFSLPEEKPVLLSVPPAQAHSRTRSRSRYLSAVVLLVVAMIAIGAWGTYRLLSPVSALDNFWTPILENPNRILLCVGSPSATLPAAAQSSVSADNVARGRSFGAFTLERSTIVAISDVNAANDVASFLRTRKKDSTIYPASSVNMWELRSNSVVVFGNFENYWATKLGANLRFHFNRESELGKRWIEDANNPAHVSWTLDMSAPVDQVDSDYAVISRVLDQSTGQWWVGIAGLTTVGSSAAYQLLIDPKAMAEASSKFPKGWQKKNMQIVLGVTLVDGNPGITRVLATNFW